MRGNFFIWCAGSDSSTLRHCPRSERTNHIGFGTLVLIPAILALVSMSYALTTITPPGSSLLWPLVGGLVWAVIIFCFDRYIVSSHRRKLRNQDELKSPAFYLRFFFALILGIVISHPIVLLYFKGSIEDQMAENVKQGKEDIRLSFADRQLAIETRKNTMDSLYRAKEAQRDEQARIVEREIDGEVMRNASGQAVTTGLYGKGPSAENKIRHLNQLEAELKTLKIQNQSEKALLTKEINLLKTQGDKAVEEYTVSSDYLKRELALEQLKDANPIVAVTQWLLMLLFILVDILPVTFKTFSPFGLYDKILLDDSEAVRKLQPEGRRKALEEAYESVNLELLQPPPSHIHPRGAG